MMEAVPCTAIKGGSNAMGPPANPMAPPPAQTPRGKADAAPLCTPHNGRSGANGVTGTAMRAPRVGETLLSANGSPLGMLPPSSVVLKRTKAGDKAQPEEVSDAAKRGEAKEDGSANTKPSTHHRSSPHHHPCTDPWPQVFEVTVEGDVLNIKSPSAVNKVGGWVGWVRVQGRRPPTTLLPHQQSSLPPPPAPPLPLTTHDNDNSTGTPLAACA